LREQPNRGSQPTAKGMKGEQATPDARPRNHSRRRRRQRQRRRTRDRDSHGRGQREPKTSRQRQRQPGRTRDTERNKKTGAETETQGAGRLLLHRSQRSGAAQAHLTPAPLNPSTRPAPSARGDEGENPSPRRPGKTYPRRAYPNNYSKQLRRERNWALPAQQHLQLVPDQAAQDFWLRPLPLKHFPPDADVNATPPVAQKCPRSARRRSVLTRAQSRRMAVTTVSTAS
jgi:hypothetical protein